MINYIQFLAELKSRYIKNITPKITTMNVNLSVRSPLGRFEINQTSSVIHSRDNDIEFATEFDTLEMDLKRKHIFEISPSSEVSNFFIPAKIQLKIMTETFFMTEITADGISNVSLTLYSENPLTENEISKYQSYLVMCSAIIQSITEMTGKTFRLVPYVVYLLPDEKIYYKTAPIGVNEMNSGFTDTEKVFIYRSEELLKVMIHETIHVNQLERILIDNIIELNRFVKSGVDYKGPSLADQPFEHFVEYLAEILYHAINSMFNPSKFAILINNEINETINTIREVMSYECECSEMQTCKLSQNGNFVNYYVVRAMLLCETAETGLVISKITSFSDYKKILSKAMKNKNYFSKLYSTCPLGSNHVKTSMSHV